MLRTHQRQIGSIHYGTGLAPPAAIRSMTGRTVSPIDVGTPLRVAGGLGHIRRRSHSSQSIGVRPGSDPVYQGIDLLVGEHSTRTLRKRGHGRAGHSVGDRAPNHIVVGNGEQHGIRQSAGGSTPAILAMASGAVFSIDNLEGNDLARRFNLGFGPTGLRRPGAGVGSPNGQNRASRQAGRGRRDAWRPPETAATHVAWLITQRRIARRATVVPEPGASTPRPGGATLRIAAPGRPGTDCR